MSRKVVFRVAAEKDLAKLYKDIKDSRGGDPTVAINYLRRLRSYCEGFADFPERGVRRDDVRPGLRIIGLERRVAKAFMFDDEKAIIGRVFYVGRDYEAALGKQE